MRRLAVIAGAVLVMAVTLVLGLGVGYASKAGACTVYATAYRC